ncbi:MAG TPA: metallophosphoesterase [Syntrophales bacterium]|nr:metallophosphoesterase [Syntrophales bacterium]HOX94705.1 metallophosphoesterase [Syntrophales bacterium]HPI58124.1 metallophosphoesterase [Syntrophales bacterium]HPN24659.1 metallophosphoesterase [Syntrophales bacterium]HQM28964.1 metallophosphoesterase [Syntrophales bacterium]
MSLFLISFFLIYGGIHLYAYLKLRTAAATGPLANLLIILFMVFMVLAPVLVRVAERQGFDPAAHVLSWIGYVWMGFLLLFFSASILFDLYRFLLWAGGWVARKDLSYLAPAYRFSFYVPLALSIVLCLYGYFEALNIRVERVVLKSPKIPESLGKVTVAQISDVHLGLIVRQGRLERILGKVRESNPDVLVSTGDLVDGQINKLESLADMFGRIQPRFGKYAVTGNHEYHAGLEQALAFTEKAGFTILRGEGRTVAGLINIAGVDDPAGLGFRRVRSAQEREILSSLPQDKFTLFLKHRPRVDGDALGFFDLQASGHTHNGQIFPFTLLIRMVYPENSGLTPLGHSFLYVSRGTGTWGPPIRFLAPPEVTIFEIRHDGAPR